MAAPTAASAQEDARDRWSGSSLPRRSRCRRRGPRDGWQREGCRDDVGRHDGGNDRQHLDHSDDCDYCHDYGDDDRADHDDRHGSHDHRDDASSRAHLHERGAEAVGLARISTKPCKPDKAPQGAVAAIKCGIDGPVKVRHVRFPTAAAMNDYYESLIPSGTEKNAGTCGASDPAAENEYTNKDGTEIGRLLCYEAGEKPRLAWTNTPEHIVSFAYRADDQGIDSLVTWWEQPGFEQAVDPVTTTTTSSGGSGAAGVRAVAARAEARAAGAPAAVAGATPTADLWPRGTCSVFVDTLGSPELH